MAEQQDDVFRDQHLINHVREALWRRPSGACVMVGSGFSRNASKVRPDTADIPLWSDLENEFAGSLPASDPDRQRSGDQPFGTGAEGGSLSERWVAQFPSDASKRVAAAIGRPALAPDFQKIRDQFSGPEEINDSKNTAPSKRIGDLVGGYSKPRLGALAADAIGLDAMRSQCPHFGSWLDQLERLPAAVANRSGNP